LSVVVPSHGRPLRLRWLLNALQEQTLERFEVVVVHDGPADGPTDRLLATHPLAAEGTLRGLRAEPCGAAVKRNLGWRAARGALVAFTDDDCRPPAGWLAGMLDAARGAPGAVVQGRTTPDPDELAILHHAPHAHTMHVEPPTPWGQTCNIAFPRALLEQLDGFDETLTMSGEDTDLLQRALDAGALQVAAPGVLTHHAVVDQRLGRALRQRWRWQDVAGAVKRHPRLREPFPLHVFWKPRHATLLLALGGALAAGERRTPLPLLLVLPWAAQARPEYGPGPRALVRGLGELPGQAAIDAVELAALVRGSIRHRTLVL
jgi:GT2 family glycosyltransferase